MASKTVLITGSNRGLGLSFAKYYTKAGWNVIATARDSSNIDDLKALSPFKVVAMDVRDESTILQMAQELSGIPIDVVINNSGISTGSGDMSTTTKDSLMKEFEVHAVGPLLVTRSLLPNLKLAAKKNGKHGARVAHLSSVWASVETGSGPYAYAASKAALHIFNHRMADEMKRHHIATILLDPGYVATNLPRSSYETEADRVVESMVGIIDKSKLKDSGRFYHFQGYEIPWRTLFSGYFSLATRFETHQFLKRFLSFGRVNNFDCLSCVPIEMAGGSLAPLNRAARSPELLDIGHKYA